MAKTTKLLPYEFLVRWDDNGVYQGASFTPRVLTYDSDGELVSSQIANPIPLRDKDGNVNSGLSDDLTASLHDVVGQMFTDVSAQANILEGQKAEMSATIEALQGDKSSLEAQVAALAGQLETARSKVKEGEIVPEAETPATDDPSLAGVDFS